MDSLISLVMFYLVPDHLYIQMRIHLHIFSATGERIAFESVTYFNVFLAKQRTHATVTKCISLNLIRARRTATLSIYYTNSVAHCTR